MPYCGLYLNRFVLKGGEKRALYPYYVEEPGLNLLSSGAKE